MSDARPASSAAPGSSGSGANQPGERWDAGDTARLVAWLRDAGQTVATAESLTGGLVAAALTDPAGASAVVRGGIVAYHSDVKADLVGVDPRVLSGGAVQAEVARQLADGARSRFGATWGVGTTGVAGPQSSDGAPVGTVYVAVCGPGRQEVAALTLVGDRAAIRGASVAHALSLLAATAGSDSVGLGIPGAGADGEGEGRR